MHDIGTGLKRCGTQVDGLTSKEIKAILNLPRETDLATLINV